MEEREHIIDTCFSYDHHQAVCGVGQEAVTECPIHIISFSSSLRVCALCHVLLIWQISQREFYLNPNILFWFPSSNVQTMFKFVTGNAMSPRLWIVTVWRVTARRIVRERRSRANFCGNADPTTMECHRHLCYAMQCDEIQCNHMYVTVFESKRGKQFHRSLNTFTQWHATVWHCSEPSKPPFPDWVFSFKL